MKKKVVLTLIVVLIMAIASAVILSGCNNTLREVTEIRVEDTEIFMAPRGEPSTYQINASVLPITAKIKLYILDMKKIQIGNLFRLMQAVS